MRSPTITISHSMTDKPIADSVARLLSWKGAVVLLPIDMRESLKKIKNNPELENRMREYFQSLQFQRILLSDILIAIRKKNKTFGDETIKEMEFANKTLRPVIVISSVVDITSEKIIEAMRNSSANSYEDLSTDLIQVLQKMETMNIDEMARVNIRNILESISPKLFQEYKVHQDTTFGGLQDA